MNKSSNRPPKGSSNEPEAKPDRRARVADALRQNLRKRKAQARGRKADSVPTASGPSDGKSEDGGSED